MAEPTRRKQLTHQRIVETAARAIRRGGFQGVGVADIMKEAGLTHGGFYAHFASRDALLVEALAQAGADGAQRLSGAIRQRQERGLGALRALVESYLSDRHLAGIEEGCPVAALVGEVPRQAPEVRDAAGARVRALLARVADALPAGSAPDEAAAIAAQLVGGLQLARALGDGAEARALLAATRRTLLARHDRASNTGRSRRTAP